MRDSVLYSFFFIAFTFFFTLSTLNAQSPLIFTTGGDYGAVGNQVKLYSYQPSKDSVFVEDSVPGDFSNDVLYDGEYYYMHVGRASGHSAGGDAIYQYEPYSFDVVDSIKPISGAMNLGVHGEHLVVTRGFGAGSEFVRVYDRNDLSAGPTYADDSIGTAVNGLTIRGDSAYLGYTANDTGHIATLDLSGTTPSFGTVHPLDTMAAGINQLMQDQDSIYALSERFDASFSLMYAGITAFDPATGSFSVDTNDRGSNSGVMARNDSVWAKVDSLFDVYESSTGNITEYFPIDHSAGTFDEQSGHFYFQRTDFIGQGDLLLTDASGTKIDSFDTDVSGEALHLADTTWIDAGNDKTVCADAEDISISATSATANGTWISSGNGSFGDPDALNTTYTPSDADTANGSVQLTVINTDTGHFAPDSASMTLIFKSLPEPDAGADIQAVVADDTISVSGTLGGGATDGQWGTYGSGSFEDPNALNTDYYPSQGDKDQGSVNLYLTATNNGDCEEEDMVNIDFTDVSIAEDEAGSDRLKLRPVPAGSELFVDLPDIAGPQEAEYEVLDMTGKVHRRGSMRTGTEERLNVEGLTEGVYFLRIRTEDEQYHRKWMKR